MIKLLAILFLIPFSYQSFCQITIDDIKNDKDAVQFVSEYGKKNNTEWKKVSVDDLYGFLSKKTTNPKEKIFLDSIIKNKWIKADFNKDGRMDLIFFGKLYNELSVLSFISSEDSLKFNYLGNILSGFYPSGINGFNLNGLNLLSISSFVRNNNAYNFEGAFKTDTLIYKFDGFIEYNTSSLDYIEFDSIICRTTSPWLSLITVPEIKIYKNGLAVIYHRNLKDRIETKTCILNNGTAETIKELLSYMNIKQLKDKYAIEGVTDLGTLTTRIFYQGKTKVIEDYGGHGTFGLSLLYDKFNEIKSGCIKKEAE